MFTRPYTSFLWEQWLLKMICAGCLHACYLIEAKMSWLWEWEHGRLSMCVCIGCSAPTPQFWRGVFYFLVGDSQKVLFNPRYLLWQKKKKKRKWGSNSLLQLHTWCYHNCLCSCCRPEAAVSDVRRLAFLQTCSDTTPLFFFKSYTISYFIIGWAALKKLKCTLILSSGHFDPKFFFYFFIEWSSDGSKTLGLLSPLNYEYTH